MIPDTPFPVLLAHGALGIWDEVIFISVAVIFIGMMGLSWFRARQMNDDAASSASSEASASDALPSDAPAESAAPDRFKLD